MTRSYWATYPWYLAHFLSVRNAALTVQHQRDILDVLARCHTCYLELLSSIFQLHTAPVEDLVKLVRQVLECGRMKEAAVYIATFGIQDRFSLDQVRKWRRVAVL